MAQPAVSEEQRSGTCRASSELHMGRLDIDPTAGPDLADVVVAQRERAKTLVEMAQNSVYFYRDFDAYDEKAASKNLRPEVLVALTALRDALAQAAAWTDTAIHELIQQVADAHGLAMGKLAQPLRVALTGGGVSHRST